VANLGDLNMGYYRLWHARVSGICRILREHKSAARSDGKRASRTVVKGAG
jgi:hypothetical protein